MKINQRICRSLDVFARQKRGMTECGGRSMVEMLGVLAIIGVLSAGALAGYSKAMFRHKMNQTIDIFQGVLQRFAELEQKGLGKNGYFGYDGDGTAIDIIKYGLLPSCQTTEDGACKLPIGTLDISFLQGNSYVSGQFVINFTDSKSCVSFASAGWESAVPIEWWNRPDEDSGGYIIVYGNDGAGKFIYNLHDPSYNKVSMQNIIKACQICDEEGGCEWWLAVRGEV